jgi:dinuclear metal center YbgI/SA1388 family protein
VSKIPNGYEVIQLFESFAPKKLAMEGDKIGLQVGTLNKPIRNVMITLDVLDEVIDEAVSKQVDLIIAHHPPIFRPLKHILTDQMPGRLFEKCIKHDIAVYAAHTNLDIAVGGVNDLLAEALQLTDTDILIPTEHVKLKKLAVYVPVEHEEKVRAAICQAGAGHIGNYSDCTFNTPGTGTFLPQEGTTPFIGQKGQLEKVNEVKIETIFPEDTERKIIQALLKSHPYEEPAYDIYLLENQGMAYGLGRIGKLKQEMTLKEFAEHVKKTLDVEAVRVTGSLEDKVQKVAVLGGDGNKYISNAKYKGADVYVTGDLYFHVAHDAMMMGLNVVDPGHHVEKVMINGVTRILSDLCAESKFDCEVIPSEIDTNPFTII